MSKIYSLSEIKLAAYNYLELADLNYRQHSLWLGLAYAYDCYRAGEPKEVCEKIMQNYINLFWDGDADDS